MLSARSNLVSKVGKRLLSSTAKSEPSSGFSFGMKIFNFEILL